MRYLDPKNDLTFKKIFGTHPNLVMSLLNSLLPLVSPIISVEYLSAEQVPQIPSLKNSIVDVCCTDQNGRIFIVEMQMLWTDSFKQRVVFNAAKSYVKQIGKGHEYKELKPVYALSLVNEIFEPNSEFYYHHYSLIHSYETDKKLEGLEFVFVELPKFVATTLDEKKMKVLWLRFLTEIQDGTSEIPIELIENEETREALSVLEESSYTLGELDGYDRYWDRIRTEISFISDAERMGEARGEARGEIIGEARGEIIGQARGEEKSRTNIIITGFNNGFTLEQLALLTNLTPAAVSEILKNNGLV
jgi:predicted transposase/invertase (TIGR01784 family)